MKKTITITAHNRIDYLKDTLHSLVQNDLSGWQVIASVEPTRVRGQIIDEIETILADNVDFIIREPLTRLGDIKHNYDVLRYAFDEQMSDVNIYLEDDLILSPDITKIADWYMTLPRNAFTGYGGVQLCNLNSKEEQYTQEEACEFFADAYQWGPLGWITDRTGWREQLKFNWNRRNHHINSNGWDWAIRAHTIWHGMKWLYPKVSRSNHMGEFGTHVTPQTQQRYGFSEIVCLKERMKDPQFVITNHSCEEANNLCFVVPYRDREQHLEIFVPEIKHHMQTYHPNINFEIHIIDQNDEKPFNRAKLLNVGYDLNKAKDCYFCFHDVDLIPEGSCCDYSYASTPTHLSAYCSQYNYALPYGMIFGGVTIFDKLTFEKVNGYSNEYWGWGAEDDDIRRRLDAAKVLCQDWMNATKGIIWKRRDGHFLSLPHLGSNNPTHQQNVNRLRSGYDYSEDGLSSLEYELISTEKRDGYTIHKVRL